MDKLKTKAREAAQGGLRRFEGRLYRPEGPRMMTVLPLPAELTAKGGFRARQRVRGRIDELPIATTILSSGEGWLALVINRELLARLGRAAGDAVQVELEPDEGPVQVELPPALETALEAEPRAKESFEALAPSHRKAYAVWVGSAKQDSTRDERARKAVGMLLEGKKLRP